jgi:hypothetical protein
MDFSREHDRVIPQKCPVCGAQRDSLFYVPLGYDEERTIVHISCKKCSGAAMIFVSQNDTGLMTVGVLTDTTPHEAKQFFDSHIVSDNDVIAVHDYLREYDGYISEMF